MSKIILIFIFIILAVVNQPVFAKKTSVGIICRETYFVDVPGEAKINKFSDGDKAIGFVDESQDSLLTDSVGFLVASPKTVFKDSGGFSRLVEGSYTNSSWQLTTARPLGMAVTYNTSGYIEAKFLSLGSFNTTDLSIYPSIIAFGVGKGAGVKGHIFKFYPMVRVSKDIVPDTYSGVINLELTVMSL